MHLLPVRPLFMLSLFIAWGTHLRTMTAFIKLGLLYCQQLVCFIHHLFFSLFHCRVLEEAKRQKPSIPTEEHPIVFDENSLFDKLASLVDKSQNDPFDTDAYTVSFKLYTEKKLVKLTNTITNQTD